MPFSHSAEAALGTNKGHDYTLRRTHAKTAYGARKKQPRFRTQNVVVLLQGHHTGGGTQMIVVHMGGAAPPRSNRGPRLHTIQPIRQRQQHAAVPLWAYVLASCVRDGHRKGRSFYSDERTKSQARHAYNTPKHTYGQHKAQHVK